MRKTDVRRETGEDKIESAPENGRIAEQGESDEPDAPTAGEENEGMSTILSAEPALGVQPDASEE